MCELEIVCFGVYSVQLECSLRLRLLHLWGRGISAVGGPDWSNLKPPGLGPWAALQNSFFLSLDLLHCFHLAHSYCTAPSLTAMQKFIIDRSGQPAKRYKVSIAERPVQEQGIIPAAN